VLDARAHDGDADGQGAGPGATTDLVETGDRLVPLGAQAPLLLEVRRADGHLIGYEAGARPPRTMGV
jgi:hypothetical protein